MIDTTLTVRETTEAIRQNSVDVVLSLCGMIKPTAPLNMLDWACKHFVIATGDLKGTLFNPLAQPAARLWLEACDSGEYLEHWLCSSAQSGKSVSGFLIPCIYWSCYMGESVILAAPTAEILSYKYEMDLKPAIMASAYRDLLPTKGKGSEGGFPDLLKLANGGSIKFVTGNGSDRTRSSYSARILCVTEAAGMSVSQRAVPSKFRRSTN